MSGHESHIIVGKLSRDPELKYSSNGTPVARFSIPVDRRVGEERKTAWWNIVVFGKIAESAKQNLRKGSIVRAEGVVSVDSETMCPRVFESSGSYRSSLEMIANSLTYIDNFGGGEKKAEGSDARQETLPF